MANCEQIGSYGVVSRIQGSVESVECQCTPEIRFRYVDLTARQSCLGVFWGLFKSTITGRDTEEDKRGAIIHGILHHDQVDEDGIGWLASHSRKMDRGSMLFLARFFNDLIMVDMRMAEAVKRNSYGRKTRPYTLDRRLADMFEVLPTDLSARFLLAASDPDISRSVSAIPIGGLLQRPDNQRYAAEGFSLLPQDVMYDRFRAMVQLLPGRRSGAGVLLGLIASEGIPAISRNLSGEEASRKILEVQSSLVTLGQIIGS